MKGLVLTAVLLAGCNPNQVSGSVNGESAGAGQTAIYDELTLDLGILGTYQTIGVIVTDLPEACQVLEETFEAQDMACEARCTEYGRIADTWLGRDKYWSVNLQITPAASQVGPYTWAADPGEDQFDGLFSSIDLSKVYDHAVCMDECSEGRDPIVTTDDDAGGGTLEVTEYVAGETVAGEFDIEFGADDSLKGRFAAEPCDISSFYGF